MMGATRGSHRPSVPRGQVTLSTIPIGACATTTGATEGGPSECVATATELQFPVKAFIGMKPCSNVSGMSRITTLSLMALLLAAATTYLIPPNNQATLVQIGSHKMFLNCTGKAPGPTVILEAGTGDSS